MEGIKELSQLMHTKTANSYTSFVETNDATFEDSEKVMVYMNLIK